MDTSALSRLRAVLLLLFFVSRAAVEGNTLVYFKKGGDLVLKPSPDFGDIRSVSWKLNGDVVAEWVRGSVQLGYWGKLKDRATMDTTTGVLTITNMNSETAGVYTAEINDQLQLHGYQTKELKEVPKPEVAARPLSCSSKSEKCSLICTGETEGAEPVTFFWKRGEEEWKEGIDSIDIINTKEEREKKETRPKTYSCRMNNPVSVKDSLAFLDPFFSTEEYGSSSIVGVIVGSIVVVLLAAAVGIALCLYFFKDKEPVSGWLTSMGCLTGERGETVPNGGTPHNEVGSPDPSSVAMLEKTS